MNEERKPVSLLTGFLGAGKTTLLNRLLGDPDAEPTAVIVNEFGETGIDGSLIGGAALAVGDDQTDGVLELANGCICCTVKGDLQRTLLELAMGKREFRRVLVETSGLASPGPIGRTLFIDPALRERFVLDGVVTLCHARNVVQQLKQFSEAREQVALADRLILNHVDQASEALVAEAEGALRELSAAPIERSERARVAELGALRELGSSDPERWELAGSEGRAHAHSSAMSVVLESAEPLDLHRLKIWLQFLGARRTHALLRVKGLLRCDGRSETVVVQGMHDWLEIGPGENEAPEVSRLVVLGLGLDEGELKRGFAAAVRSEPR